MSKFEINQFLDSQVDSPRLIPGFQDFVSPKSPQQICYENYLFSISPSFSVLFDKSQKKLYIYSIILKQTKSNDSFDFKSMTFLNNTTLIGYSQQIFYIINMEDLFTLDQNIPKTIHTQLTCITKIGIDHSNENSIFALDEDSHSIYRVNIEISDSTPQLLFEGVDLYSPTPNGLFIALLDCIKLINIDGENMTETFSLPIMDAIGIAGGQSRFAVLFEKKVEIYDETGQLTNTTQSFNTMWDQGDSSTLINNSIIAFIEPYYGETRAINTIAAGITNETIFYWTHDHEIRFTNLSNAKTNISLNIKNQKTNSNTNSDSNNSNRPNKTREDKRREIQKKRENAKQSKPKQPPSQQQHKQEEKPVEQNEGEISLDLPTTGEARRVPFIIYSPTMGIKPNEFDKILLPGDQPLFILPFSPLHFYFGAIMSIHSQDAIKQSLMYHAGKYSEVDIFDDAPSVDPLFIITIPYKDISNQHLQALSKYLHLNFKSIGNVFTIMPDSNFIKSVYMIQYFKHLKINGHNIHYFEKPEQIPLVMLSFPMDIDLSIINNLKQNVLPPGGVAIPAKKLLFVYYENMEQVNQVVAKDYYEYNGKAIEICRFTFPMMKDNKELNLRLSTQSKDTEYQLFQAFKNKFNGLQHVWREQEEVICLFFLTKNDVIQAMKKLNKPIKLGRDTFSLIN